MVFFNNNSTHWYGAIGLCGIGLSRKKPFVSSSQAIYKQVSGSVYTLFGIGTEGSEEIALGSAVAISEHLLATNCHVALAGNILFIRINNQNELGSVVYHNDNADFCLVSVNTSNFTPVKIRQSSQVQIGEEVIAIGNPKGYQKSISKGIISNKYDKNNLPLELDNFYPALKYICEKANFVVLQTDAPISHGSSGGGLFDQNGNLIGITTSGDARGENLGFAIPTELILKIIEPKSLESKNQQIDEPPTNQATESEPIKTPITSTINLAETDNSTLVGYYGKSKIGLFHLNNRCFITITGHYSPDKPTSTALWFPDNPKTLIIFSRVVTLDKATKFLDEKNSFQYSSSKSFIFIENQLYPLTIISLNNEKNPVYLFTTKQDQTETFIRADYFLGQFYHYSDQSDMTTIKFDLDGFTEAFAAYNKSCK